ncbi:MAG TPA: hypothetical protein VK911_12765 [Vicinamibacterales bacterium]|nr:hypothetical protein [Vicinamibacterales bacterium]
MRNAPFSFALAVVVLWSGAVQAQSLAEVAKKEEDRRKTVKGSGKVYTNDDLRRYPVTTPAVLPGQTDEAAGQKPATAPGAGAEAGIPAPEKVGDEKKDETYWKKRVTDAREQLRRSEGFLEAMQTRVNSLTNDFYARDDPAQRAVVWSQRTAALEEMDRLTKEIAGYKKAIASIEEEARREGVPPGWLR